MAISIDVIPNRSSPPAILLRRAWREGKRIRRETLANLTKMPPDLVNGLRALIKGGVIVSDVTEAVTIQRSLPHGHVLATLGTARSLGLERILARKTSRMRELALATIIARVVQPESKLATARALSPDTAASSLGTLLSLGPVHGNELLDMLDWLRERQPWIERSLANRHLAGGTLILYDVSSSYVEGRKCPLAAFGYNRDGKKGKKQITFGLLCAQDGCPIAVEVFSGNTADPSTVSVQLDKLRQRFGIHRIAVVGDRGMITTARIRQDLEPRSLDWISAFKTADIRKLLVKPQTGDAPLVPEDLAPDQVAEITSPAYPDEHLLVCLNPRLREERARKREALLRATEETLEKIARTVHRSGSKLRGRARIAHRIGREANRRKVEKHFTITITDDTLTWSRNQEKIAREARLDGLYVVRTSLGPGDISGHEAVYAYKSLSLVEQAFRACKSTRLHIRPIHVYTETHVRGHVFLVMLAWYIEWHMRRSLAPILFEDSDPEGARLKRSSPVEPSKVSDEALEKASTKTTADGLPVHSMTTLLSDLATCTLNEVTVPAHPDQPFTMISHPTELQARAFELLGIKPSKYVAM